MLSWVFLCVFVLQHLDYVISTPPIPPELYSPLIFQKLLSVAQNLSTPATYPHYTGQGGQEGRWIWFPEDYWTSGFFPASMTLVSERGQKCPSGQLISTADASTMLNEARAWSAPLTTLEANNDVGHDVGFVSFPFQEDLKLNSTNSTAQAAVDAFAADLAGRFSPIVGCTRSWDSDIPDYFEVIIDNMINIDIFFMSNGSADGVTYQDMAIAHSDHTMTNHVRPDGSTYHLVIYNETDGSVIARETAQGYANDSTWTRGQSWAMYGFTSMYRRTQLPRYLDTARQVSQFYLDHLPSGNTVPPWDFDAPSEPTPPRDTSSGTIASSAMLLLSQVESSIGNSTGADYWINNALTLLRDTISLAWRPEPQWQALLSNGTSNGPQGNNNTGLIYGDYYFIRAGNILLDMGLANCSAASGQPTASCGDNCSSASSPGKGQKSGAGRLRSLYTPSILTVLIGLLFQ